MHRNRSLRALPFVLALACCVATGCGDNAITDPSGTDVAQDAGANDVTGLPDGEATVDGQPTDSATGVDATAADAVVEDVAAVDGGSEDDALADGGADDGGADDGGPDDGGADDGGGDAAVDAGPVCPGGPGCDCTEDADCDAGSCMMGSDGGKYCAAPCTKDDDCAAEHVCDSVAGTSLCVPAGIAACAPCMANKDCALGGGGACVDMGAAGAYCGTDCDKDDDCATGEACAAAKDVDGKDVKQCLPKDGGACACSAWAIASAAKTTCYAEGKPGCTAERACLKKAEPGAPADGGLADCAPPAGSDEVCDDKDNDCDGDVDEGGDALCDDNNVCTDDSCDKAKGCANVNNSASCDDEDKCTKDDACAVGMCTGATVACDDGDVCTDDSCDKASGCKTAHNTAACDDGDACTKDDACAVGLCAGASVTCDDNNPCTDDSCDKTKGCVTADNNNKCDDGNACTKDDACTKGTCSGAALTCDDGKVCTDDSCDKALGCVAKNNSAKCDDKNACTKDDVCAVGLCAGATLTCDDGNACTDDACDKATGCTTTNNNSKCDDNNKCTKDDICATGKCGGASVKCDDNNPCTDDKCDTAVGCVASNNSGKCDDGDPCTDADACNAGKCAGSAKKCDDSNVCTADSCSKAIGGCVFKKLDGGKCEDGSACSEKDHCKAGKCAAGAKKVCTDGNTCTKDGCDPKTGCIYPPAKDGSACDDGDKCTGSGGCKASKCQPGKKIDCDDGDMCTADSCDSKTGCKHSGIKGCGSKPFPLPFVEPFNCGSGSSKIWQLGGYSNGPSWAVDGTPAVPGYKSPKCSLNFNNGKNYNCPTGLKNINKSAVSPAIDLGKALLPVVSFQLGGDWEFGSWDDVNLAVSIDGAKTWKQLATYNDVSNNGWALRTWDLAAYKGKVIHLAWQMFTKDCQFNATSGAFVDDISILDMACKGAPDCDDGNACTTDACTLATGKCSQVAVKDGAPCDDGDLCTDNGCKTGKCIIASTKKCDDGNACTHQESCNAKDGKCLVGFTETCNDGDACTSDACDTKTGGCSNKPIAGCLAKCKVDADCDDNNVCTADSCDTKAGTCAVKPGKPGVVCGGGTVCDKSGTCKAINVGWARQLSGHAYGYHFCAVTWDRRVACWGYNAYYQTGYGASKSSVSKPTLVKGSPTGVKKVSAGRYHSCALTEKGEVWCWGRNNHGQTAPGVKASALATPYKIPNLGAAVDVGTGYDTTCAVHADRTMSCWGYNGFGNQGHGDTKSQQLPKKVAGLSGVRGIDMAYNHACVLRLDGSLWCAGSNTNFETSETAGSKWTYTRRKGVPAMMAVVTGRSNTCGGKSGAWACVGDNGYGQLGNGGTTDSKLPVPVKGPKSPVAMDGGYLNHLALTPGGEVWGVGYDSYGQLGLGSAATSRKSWVKTGFGPSVDAAAGYRTTCTLAHSGQVWCAGYNYYRALGNGSGISSNKPVLAIGLCADNKMCDDGNGCTVDTCDTKTGACGHKATDGNPCDDGVACTDKDVCSKGKCGGKPIVCDDKNPCTLGEKCVADKDGKPSCSKGTPKVCDDKNSCTDDSCDIATGKCVFKTKPGCVPACKSDAECADGNVCTTNTCILGKCINKNGNEGGFCAIGQVCGAGKCAASGKGWASKISGSTNGRHFCAVGTDKKAWCWGEGSDYRLGIKSTSDRSRPVQVPGLSNVTDVVACYSHSCAQAGGKWYCWGDNTYGAVGKGISGFSDINTPTLVTVASGIVKMTCGYRYTCGLLKTGKVRCWGYQSAGRLGSGSTSPSALPKGAEVKGLSNAVDLWSAYGHSCARKNDGTVWCWGFNYDRQLSGAPLSTFTSPVQKIDAKGASFATGSYSTVCWGKGGKGWCAGDNDNGQLGKTAGSDTPGGVAVSGPPGVAWIEGGYDHNALLATDGSVWVTGDNDNGQLGIGSTQDQGKWTKSKLPAGQVAVQVEAAGDTTCALTGQGHVFCTGDSVSGQLGSGGTTDIALYAPVSVHCTPGQKCTDGNACTHSDACVLGYCSGKAVVCNDNNKCTTGDHCIDKSGAPSCVPGVMKACDDLKPCTADSCDAKTGACKYTPIKGCLVKCKSAADCNDHNICTKDVCNTKTGACDFPFTNQGTVCGQGKVCGAGKCSSISAGWAKQIAADAYGRFFCALRHSGTVACWGDNSDGQIGNGNKTDQTKPVVVASLSGVTKVTTGSAHTCALLANGKTGCWGFNYYGQLGNGVASFTDQTKPVLATKVPPLADIWAAHHTTCGRAQDGAFYCWGYGAWGERGDGTTTSAGKTAVKVVGLPTGVVDLDMNYRRRCALTAKGDVWCWGYNSYRDVAVVSATKILVPTKRTNVAGLTVVGGGRYFTCGTSPSKNQTLCWGDNSDGQLGYGAKGSPSTIARVVKGLPGLPALMRGGDDHQLMLMGNGTLYAAGDANYYQLGNKSKSDSTTAVKSTEFSMPLVGVTAAYNSTCGLGKDGQVYCLGTGTDGQLGYGSKSSSSTLKKVLAP